MVYVILMIVSGEALNGPVMYQLPIIMTKADCEQAKRRLENYRPSDVPSVPYLMPLYPSSLSDLAQRAGLGRIGALIRPFFVAGWDAVGQFPRD